MEKIYSEEVVKDGFDDVPFEELQNMIGWIEPDKNDEGTWTVTMTDGFFDCKTQESAFILGGLEEVKAMLMRK